MSLPTGSFTAVMGPSGSGKSTPLSCAAGLATPTSGRVAVGSYDITTLSPDELTRFRREHVGFVFQACNLVLHLSVADNVALPVLLSGRPTDPAWQAELLDAVGLGGPTAVDTDTYVAQALASNVKMQSLSTTLLLVLLVFIGMAATNSLVLSTAGRRC